MTQDVRIDRLSLRVPGLDEDAARDLARRVALRLANDLPVSGNPISDYRKPGDPSTSSGRRNRSSSKVGPALRLEVAPQASYGADLDGLAWRIAGEIRQAIEREANQ